MTGKKRTHSGQVKPTAPSQQPAEEPPVPEPTPPCAQPQKSCSTSNDSHTTFPNDPTPQAPPDAPNTSISQSRSRKQKRQNRPTLPANTTITRRPLLHPALPTPFASSSSPKVLYITASSPFIPTLKRVRKLLAEITKREAQAARFVSGRKGGPQANGRLRSGDVERGVVDEVARLKGGGGGRECVYLKATGRAIPRALELGVQFQGEGEGCVVKVEMGSVKAIDDVEVQSRTKEGGEGAGEDEGGDEDVPETRIRTISSVTVSIRTK